MKIKDDLQHLCRSAQLIQDPAGRKVLLAKFRKTFHNATITDLLTGYVRYRAVVPFNMDNW